MEAKATYEDDLYSFVRGAWHALDPTEFVDSWAMESLCLHLEAITKGDIKRLLINFPPRCGKTLVASVAWPMWVWARQHDSFLSGPQVRFLCGSYNNDLSLKIATASRRLLESPWFQHYWGDKVILTADQNAKNRFDNTAGGSRIATSVGGSLLGIGGDVVLVDDPHNTADAESDADRATVLQWWKELRTTRLNSPKQAAIVVIMQRLHEDDVSGSILSGSDADHWTHLMIPMRHDPERHCVTVLKWDNATRRPLEGWEDPRTEPGELMWPEQYGERELRIIEDELGPTMASGRLQQSPQPAGGGIFKREWWKVWEPPDGKFPPMEFVVCSADTAYTEKEENDPTGFVTLGVFLDERKQPKIMLMDAWRKRLELNGVDVPKTDPDEKLEEYVKRAMPSWGLTEWIAHSARKFGSIHGPGANKLIIEAKASGLSVAQEMRRIYRDEVWSTATVTPEGDKVARAYAVQSLFSRGLIYAPNRTWAQMAIDDCASFPKGKYKDVVDALTQGLSFLRNMGIVVHREEWEADEKERAMFRPKPTKLYPTA